MASRKAVDIARKILEEQNVDGGPSASKQASNVTSSRSQTQDDMEGVAAEPEQTVNGTDDASGDSGTRQDKNVADEERETKDSTELTNDSEIAPEGDDPYYTDNNFDKGDPISEEEDGDESDDEDDAEESMGDEDGKDSEDSIKDKMESVMNSDEIRDSMQEHVDALFSGQDSLTEEYRDRATTIFEAAVSERSRAVAKILSEEFQAKVATIREDVEAQYEGELNQLTEQVNNYLDYVVSEWMSENELQIENGLRNEITESFIDSLKGVFSDHFIDVPEERFDVLGDLQEEVESNQNQLNETLSELSEARAENKRLQKEQVFTNLTEGMVMTEREKLRDLSESVSFEDTTTFTAKIETLKESYFGENNVHAESDQDTTITLSEAQDQLVETDSSVSNMDPEVAQIANAISGRFGNKFRSNH